MEKDSSKYMISNKEGLQALPSMKGKVMIHHKSSILIHNKGPIELNLDCLGEVYFLTLLKNRTSRQMTIQRVLPYKNGKRKYGKICTHVQHNRRLCTGSRGLPGLDLPTRACNDSKTPLAKWENPREKPKMTRKS